MPKPPQSTFTNEGGKVVKTELYVGLLHIRFISGPDSADPPNHGTVIMAQLVVNIRGHRPGLSSMELRTFELNR